MYADDRDILALEPALFIRLVWDHQLLAAGNGQIASGLLTTPASLPPAVGPGSVVRINEDTLYEITERTAPQSLRISRLRPGRLDPPIPPPDLPNLAFRIQTFTPQIQLASAELAERLNPDTHPASFPPPPTSSDPAEWPALSTPPARRPLLALLTAARALSHIHRAAAEGIPDQVTGYLTRDLHMIKQRYYLALFHELLRLVPVVLRDGAIARLGEPHLYRA